MMNFLLLCNWEIKFKDRVQRVYFYRSVGGKEIGM